jgi:hypothetical protein
MYGLPSWETQSVYRPKLARNEGIGGYLFGRRSQSPVQIQQLRLVVLDRDLEQRDPDYSCHLLFFPFPLFFFPFNSS